MGVFFTISPAAGRLAGRAAIKSDEVITLPLAAAREGLTRLGPLGPAQRSAKVYRLSGYDFGNPLFNGPQRRYSATVTHHFSGPM